jgi:hypothetical protein
MYVNITNLAYIYAKHRKRQKAERISRSGREGGLSVTDREASSPPPRLSSLSFAAGGI